ncbi:MAG: M16 family metallopeptidase [Cetobacterium sp.]
MKQRTSLLILIFFTLQLLILCNTENSLKPSENLISGKLNNGLTYYILKNKKPENRASLNLVVKAGSLLETENEQGLAHFLEHMAFNGTTKYKKNELVKYLQSLGLSFGGDLNAYTSFSETVYKLQIPTNKDDLNTGFDVLKEWSSEITLDEKDVENEKKIIIEEWRLRQGISQRVGDIQKDIIFGGSHYSKRYPIGLPETINGATSELLKGYYKKWYQPQNISIVAVGDFNEKDVENIIIQNFSSLKNTNKISKPEFHIPLPTKNNITIFTDPELTTTNLNILWKQNSKPLNTKETFQMNIEKILLNSILNTRMSILSKDKNSPFSYSSVYDFSLNKNMNIFASSSSVKDNNIEKTLTDVLTNLKDVSLNGITPTELEREKINLINDLKNTISNKDSLKNDIYIDSILEFILKDNIFLTPEKEFDLVNELLNNINSESLQNISKNILSSKYEIFITSRENMKDKLPQANELTDLIQNILSQTSLISKSNDSDLKLEELKLTSGTSELKSTTPDYSEFILSNGINVLYKKTDFDKDKIYLKLTGATGSSNLDYKEYINTLFLPEVLSNSGVGKIDYNSLELYFKGKNFSVTPYINDYTNGFLITTNKENLNESLNYFRNILKTPKFDENIIDSTLKTTKELIQNRNFSPKSVFKKTYLETLNNMHPRRTPIEIDDLKYISKQNLEETFNSIFSNFNGYKLSVAGSIDEKDLEIVLNKYFSNLPVKDKTSNLKTLDVNYPKGYTKKTVVQGIDKKSSVILTFPYNGIFTVENRALFNGFSSLLNILLIENVREKIGGVYSISSSTNFEKLNFGENYLQISFSTDTKRVDEVISKTKSTIEMIQKGDFAKNKILDIRKNYELNFETAIKTNNFWINYLDKKNLISDYEFYTPMRYNNIITFDSIVNFSNRVINTNHCVEIILLPEKEK